MKRLSFDLFSLLVLCSTCLKIVTSNDMEMQLRGSKDERNLQVEQKVCTEYKYIKIAAAYDSSYCLYVGGGIQHKANKDVEKIVQLASEMYETECVKLKLHYLEGFCDQRKDEFVDMIEDTKETFGCYGITQAFDAWVKQKKAIRDEDYTNNDVYHLFYADFDDLTPIYGCSAQNAICTGENAYGVENMGLTFNSEVERRASILAHEIAANLGVIVEIDTSISKKKSKKKKKVSPYKWNPVARSALGSLIAEDACIDKLETYLEHHGKRGIAYHPNLKENASLANYVDLMLPNAKSSNASAKENDDYNTAEHQKAEAKRKKAEAKRKQREEREEAKRMEKEVREAMELKEKELREAVELKEKLEMEAVELKRKVEREAKKKREKEENEAKKQKKDAEKQKEKAEKQKEKELRLAEKVRQKKARKKLKKLKVKKLEGEEAAKEIKEITQNWVS